mmetsp:Transcript_8230/g.13316  ORF Transcript_8230/g.13316 Transcript_8230/m.13316 type:complete len:361 (+) Transcript_8230:113-1195(+)
MKSVVVIYVCLLSICDCLGGTDVVALSDTEEVDVDGVLSSTFEELSSLMQSLELFSIVFEQDATLQDNLATVIDNSGAFHAVGGELARQSVRTLAFNLDSYYTVNLTITSMVVALKLDSQDTRDYLSLIDENVTIMADFLDALEVLKQLVGTAVDRVHEADTMLRFIHYNMTQLKLDFVDLAEKFNQKALASTSELMLDQHERRVKVYASCAAGLVAGGLGLIIVAICYSIAAGIIEGHFGAQLEEQISELNTKFGAMESTMESLANVSETVRTSVMLRREKLVMFQDKLVSARHFLVKRVRPFEKERILRHKRLILKKLDQFEEACGGLLETFQKRLSDRRRRLAYFEPSKPKLLGIGN